MSSRADYLSKYLSGDDYKKPKSSKKKERSKKKDSHAPATRIVVHGQLETQSKPLQPNILEEDTDEYSPVQVAGITGTKPNKGFKRIDNGKAVKLDSTPTPEVTIQEPSQTIYRDSSGRIVDLEAKRTELKVNKEQELQDKRLQQQQINTGDIDRIRTAEEAEKEKKSTRFDFSKTDREYVEHMTKKEHFEDPLNSFADKPIVTDPVINAAGRPVYAKGAHPINRFEIKAGHFWDGIDRSNGFEERLVQKRDEAQVDKINAKAFQESYTEYDFD